MRVFRWKFLQARSFRSALPLAGAALLIGLLVSRPGCLTAAPPKVARKLDGVPATGQKSSLVAALDIAKASEAELLKVKDYTCTFLKKERIGNGLDEATMAVKFRQQPTSFYMKFLKQNQGREVLYVAGQNQGKILVHEGGLASFAGTFTFAPDAPQVMKENRYPVTNFGMLMFVKLTIQIWEKEAEHSEVQVKIGEGKFADVDCQLVEVTRPQARPGMPYHISKIWFARQSKLPLHAEHYGFPTKARQQPPLVEDYSYTNIKLNVGLTDRDFDKSNPAYSF